MSENAEEAEIIICQDVSKWFGDFQALKDVNLRVKAQELIVIIGPSGSGKSTLIRCINRLEEHQAGDIVVDGIPLTRDVRNIEQVRSETGMVFQQFNLFPHLTVVENITLAPMHVRKMKKVDALETAHGSAQSGRHPGTGGKIPRPAFRRPAGSASPSPARWRCSPRSCSLTSRPPRSTRR